MEGSFTGGYYPDLSKYEPAKFPSGHKTDFMLDDMTGFYAVAFDPKGKLGWKSNKIIDPDGDPGYDGAQIIEVLTEQADDRYLSYLMDMEIPFIIAGETEIDVVGELVVTQEPTLFAVCLIVTVSLFDIVLPPWNEYVYDAVTVALLSAALFDVG